MKFAAPQPKNNTKFKSIANTQTKLQKSKNDPFSNSQKINSSNLNKFNYTQKENTSLNRTIDHNMKLSNFNSLKNNKTFNKSKSTKISNSTPHQQTKKKNKTLSNKFEKEEEFFFFPSSRSCHTNVQQHKMTNYDTMNSHDFPVYEDNHEKQVENLQNSTHLKCAPQPTSLSKRFTRTKLENDKLKSEITKLNKKLSNSTVEKLEELKFELTHLKNLNKTYSLSEKEKINFQEIKRLKMLNNNLVKENKKVKSYLKVKERESMF